MQTKRHTRPTPPGYVEDFPTAHRRLAEAGMHPLRAARMLWNLSIDGLASETGVSRRTILSIEHRQCRPQPSTRRLLTDYFGLDAQALGLI